MWLTSEEEDVQDSQLLFRTVVQEEEEIVNMDSGDEEAANHHSAVDQDKAVDLEHAYGTRLEMSQHNLLEVRLYVSSLVPIYLYWGP